MLRELRACKVWPHQPATLPYFPNHHKILKPRSLAKPFHVSLVNTLENDDPSYARSFSPSFTGNFLAHSRSPHCLQPALNTLTLNFLSHIPYWRYQKANHRFNTVHPRFNPHLLAALTCLSTTISGIPACYQSLPSKAIELVSNQLNAHNALNPQHTFLLLLTISICLHNLSTFPPSSFVPSVPRT